ncbi:uncharacterized protein FA14DRAFT_192977 [Meira miltonrushii]|uniref:ER membrane protein complex subunit 6 n=1 Tax=Meira miltonrushii TaxID=1280837 RepID=A0A316V4T5_9BASI|nr:uncharacterized protein FA14DRAFT_192977 [Meira miltonrushii]PWN31501.1 hypothetical protein FA14DRAFT_192977 [Meira miltonrushii]
MDSAGQPGAVGAPMEILQQLHMQRFCPENVAHNAKQLYYIRSVVTSVAGSLAGVLGLINFTGFYLYLGTILITNLAILLFNVHFDPQRYLFSFNPVPIEKKGQNKSAKLQSNGTRSLLWPYLSFLLEGAQEMAFGYVLWWTLWTALIHVFD